MKAYAALSNDIALLKGFVSLGMHRVYCGKGMSWQDVMPDPHMKSLPSSG